MEGLSVAKKRRFSKSVLSGVIGVSIAIHGCVRTEERLVLRLGRDSVSSAMSGSCMVVRTEEAARLLGLRCGQTLRESHSAGVSGVSN